MAERAVEEGLSAGETLLRCVVVFTSCLSRCSQVCMRTVALLLQVLFWIEDGCIKTLQLAENKFLVLRMHY